MPYLTITDFAAGLDLRRSEMTAPAGTLRSLKNLHITPGGEIEKRFAFAKIADVDPASRGLVEQQQKLYVYMPGGPGQVDPPDEMSVGQLLLATAHIETIIDYDLFLNKVFVVITTDTAGTLQRFYDGALVPLATGRYVRTYKARVYAVDGQVLSWSAINDATDWTLPATGPSSAGNADLSQGDSDMTDLISLEVYYDKMAIFSTTAVQLWTLDPDPSLNQYQQTLRQAGTIAWRSVLQYGSGDVLYVSPDGIRSLRARNASLAAAVSDVGSPLDPLMQELFRTQGRDWVGEAISILQPVVGRFWIILPDRIYILSDFPGPKVTAWSEYNPGFVITAATVVKQRVFVRDDQNQVFAFGGPNVTGPVYDASPVEIIFPFLAGDHPATFKKFHGIDAVCSGEWDVYASYDPTTDAEDYLGKLTGPTFLSGRFPIEGHATHMSLRLRSAADGPLTLSNMIVHYDLAETG